MKLLKYDIMMSPPFSSRKIDRGKIAKNMKEQDLKQRKPASEYAPTFYVKPIFKPKKYDTL